MVKRAPACALLAVACCVAPVSAFLARSSAQAGVCRPRACSRVAHAGHRQHASFIGATKGARRAQRVGALSMSHATAEPLNIGRSHAHDDPAHLRMPLHDCLIAQRHCCLIMLAVCALSFIACCYVIFCTILHTFCASSSVF